MRKLCRALCLASLVALQGCAYSVHQNHIGDFQPYAARGGGRVVVAEVKDHVIFADISTFELIDKAYAELLGKCPDSPIVAVSTTSSTALGFFSWYNRIRLQGLCVGKAARNSASLDFRQD